MKKERKERKSAIILRKPAVAGSFYPAAKTKLDQELSNLLNQAQKNSWPGKIKVLIVPHAGLSYSGSVAAWGFKQIENENYSQVILLGVSHQLFLTQAAVFDKGAWETPLGKVEISQALAEKIIDQEQGIVSDIDSHQGEHSLEMELIFLQKVLKKFKILPILINQTSSRLADDLAQKIDKNLDKNTLLVISSDLSHYPTDKIAQEVDNKTIDAITTGQEEAFIKTLANQENQGYPNLATCACGAEAIKIALKISQITNLEFKKIKYENSSSTGGQKDQVVGYAAIAGFQKNSGAEILNESDKKEALKIARQTLEEYLSKNKIPLIAPKSKTLQESLGAFVTLKNDEELRGCIGEFEPEEPLYQVIQKMAVEAATQDPRFYPVNRDELKEINIEISVMTPKRKINNWREIKLGKQGVVVRKGIQAGTFLPQVATETGWNKEEFLSQLCSQKARLPEDCYKNPEVDLFVFEAQVFKEETR